MARRPFFVAMLTCAVTGGCSASNDPATTDPSTNGQVDSGSPADSGPSETGADPQAPQPATPTPAGLLTNPSSLTPGDAIAALTGAFDANPMVSIALTVDHQASAQSADLALPTSTVFVFGNPNLGTPLMVENPLAGLDLPLRMLVWADASEDLFVTYDSPAFLRARYGLATVDTQLMTAAGALANFASAGAGTTIAATEGSSNLQLEEGLVKLNSDADGPTTLGRLQAAIEQNPMLNAALVFDHQANAQSVDLELGFNTVVIFGNPVVGTPLMQAAPTIGLDLPLKMAVIEVEGDVVVVYTDPTFLAGKHGGIEGQDERLTTITGALGTLATAAATTP